MTAEPSSVRNARQIGAFHQEAQEVQRHLSRLDNLKTERCNFDVLWQLIADHLNLTTNCFVLYKTPGERPDPRFIDSTLRTCFQILCSNVYSGLTNPSSRWFELALQHKIFRRKTAQGPGKAIRLEENQDVLDWLKEVSDQIYQVLNSPRTKFDAVNYEVQRSIIGLGTGCMYIHGEPGEPILFQAIHINEIYIDINARGEVDTVYRVFKYTARQAVERWGREAVGDAIGRAFDRGQGEQKFEFVHCVHPADDYYGRPKFSNHKWNSFYVSMEDRRRFAASGYEEMPYVVSRWDVNINENYGTSQAVKVLADAQMLNKMVWDNVQANAKLSQPTLLLRNDTSLLPLRTHPGGIIFGGISSSGAPSVIPLQTGANTTTAMASEEQVRERIRQAFFIDVMTTPEGPTKTATESRIREAARLRVMTPMSARMEDEYASKIVMRVFNILKSQGALPPMPEILQEAGPKFVVSYLGPLAKAQKMIDAFNMLELFELTQPYLQAKPELLDNLDLDVCFRHVAMTLGLPNGALKHMNAVNQEREQRAQMLQQMAQKEEQQQDLMNQGEEVDQIVKINDAESRNQQNESMLRSLG